MANKGFYIERNGTQRAAGLPSFTPDRLTFKECLVNGHPLEIIHRRIEEQCRRIGAMPLGKLPPSVTDSTVGDLLSSDAQFLKDKYFKATGQIMPTHSKPDNVNNCSQTFGMVTPRSESLYTIIMPEKTADQVLREYGEFHRGHIVSHNHYFPSEQINRRYAQPFDRFGIFGISQGIDPSGTMMKKCLAQSDEHLIGVSKPWKDFVERTKAPLGRKYAKYLYEVPDLTFGARLRQKCNAKMLLENIPPGEQDNTLVISLSYLNQLRSSLHRRKDFDMMDLIQKIERIDKDKSGHMPLSRILEIMNNLHIRVDVAKIRTMLSHFRLIIDEGCATERVNYDQFCRLLSIEQNLPKVGKIGTVPDNMYNKETTYRQFTSDRLKAPDVGRVLFTRQHLTPGQIDDADAKLADVISPELFTRIGLGPSDFSYPRDKAQMERIFQTIVSKEDFEAIWQRLMADQKVTKEQNGMASVDQFRVEMVTKQEPM